MVSVKFHQRNWKIRCQVQMLNKNNTTKKVFFSLCSYQSKQLSVEYLIKEHC